MRSAPLLDGWTVSPKRGLFDGVGGDVAPAQPVTLPHDAMLGLPRSPEAPSGEHGGYFPGGAVEYTRTVRVDPALSHTLVLDGVYRDAVVFVNDAFAGQWTSGYSRFSVPLDPYLAEDGTAELRVEARAHKDSRWYTGLGIHRDVHLLTGPRVHLAVDGVTVTTPDIDDAGAIVQIESRVTNDSVRTRTVLVETELRGPDGSVVGAGRSPITLLAGETGTTRQRIWLADPALWGPDSPALHEAVVTVTGPDGADIESATFGIRRLQLDAHHGLRINGEIVKLRGTCVHHDNGVIGARSIAAAEDRRVRLLKQAGFNAIRSAHNPIAPALLEACDRHGMLVMDEAFDMWNEAKSPFDGSLTFAEWALRDLAAMVAKDRNHPSVVLYSIGNEIPETGRPHGSRVGRLLADELHRLDPSRFTTNGVNGLVSVIRELPPMGGADADAGPVDINAQMASMGAMMSELVASDLVTDRTEESFAVLDVAGFNYGETRYAADAERFPNRIAVGSETFPSRIDLSWPLVAELPHVIGDFTWTGWDYLGEAGIGRIDYTEAGGAFSGTSGPYPYLLAWCGDLDITGHRRPASYYREIVFGLRRDPYLAVRRPRLDGLLQAGGPWSWTDAVSTWSWDVPDGTPVTIEVYGDADEVELLQDGVSLGTAPLGREHRYRAVFETAFRPGALVAVARTGGVETGRHALRTAGDAALTVRADRTELRLGAGDLAHIEIELADADGLLVPDRDREVVVRVEGAGELLGLGSARPDTTESYLADRTTTFDGRAIAVVRPLAAGGITVTIASGGEERTVALTVAG